VQPQTRVLMRTLQRLKIPTLIFVNKIDRVGAGDDGVLRSLAEKLTPAVIPMTTVRRLGTRDADVEPYGARDSGFTSRLTELLADHDEALLGAYLADEAMPYRRLRNALAEQTGRAQVHPVFFGSAVTGAGVEPLRQGIATLLPTADGIADGPVSGTVFKVERGPAGEKVAYVRMFSGTVRTRDRLRFGGGRDAKVTGISVFDRGTDLRRTSVTAGQIGKLSGLADVQIGDPIGTPAGVADTHHFAPPTLETVVVPCRSGDKGTLHAALTQLTEQDPLIGLRQDDVRQEISVSLYGEVQKEVIEATLANEYGVEVGFRETTTICLERPTGTGAAWETNTNGRTEDEPFLATVGLRVDPAPLHTGVSFRLEVELGSMPAAYFAAAEEAVHQTLRQGLHGWQVADCVVTMTHSGYWPRQSHSHATFDKAMSSTAGDFRNLTPLVLMSALQRAGSTVYEPIHRFHLEAPADTSGPVLSLLARLRASPQTSAVRGATWILEGDVPAASVYALQQQLPSVSHGEGVLESGFDRHEPVRGAIPSRPRSDHNPLHRKEYLLHVVRRV
ncbi:MAG: GTP-binding protein, partial [Micromonosporaceae bacterium]